MFISMHIHKYTWHIGLRTHILRFSAELIEIGQFWLNWVVQKQKSGIFEAQCKLIISTNNRQTDRQTDRQRKHRERNMGHGGRPEAGKVPDQYFVIQHVSIQYWLIFDIRLCRYNIDSHFAAAARESSVFNQCRYSALLIASNHTALLQAHYKPHNDR